MQTQASDPKKDAFKNRDIQIARSGTKIVLPADPREMTYDEGIEALGRIRDQENIVVAVHEEVDAFPLEGAWALTHVLKSMFGYVLQTEATFMGQKMPTSAFVNLETGYGKSEQVIWGEVQIPGVEGKLKTGVSKTTQGQLTFAMKGEIKKKGQHIVKQVADNVRAFVKENSLYRGKAIKLQTVEDGNGGIMVDLTNPPKFLDLTKVNEDELTFSQDVQEQVQTNLFTPIEKTAECRKYGVPLKRAVLLEGPYGTGKTLTAFVTAKKADANGWTFIYLDRVQALRDTLLFARRYAPCVIFAEDIERVVSGGRSTKVDDILNNIDGLDSKNQDVLCIFTTNHLEKIEKAMLRAGRLDAVITIGPPDAKAAERLVRIYANDAFPGLLDAKEPLVETAKALAGLIPAFIREAVNRSKLYAINHTKKGQSLRLTDADLAPAAASVKTQAVMATMDKVRTLSTGERLENVMAEIIHRAETTDEYTFDDNGHVTASEERTRLQNERETAALN